MGMKGNGVKMKLLAIFGSLLCAASLLGESFSLAPVGEGEKPALRANDVVKVRGKGMGANKTEALKDAYRDAVERAVGLFVDAEQMVKNDEILKDQVLTQSNAYIEKYDLVKESEADGLVHVDILAVVRKSALVTKVSGFMPVQTQNLGNALQNAHAQIVSKEKRGRDGVALLKNALSGVDPVRMLIRAGISPETQKITNEGEYYWFDGRNIPAGKIGLSYIFKLELDRERYFSEFVPKLKQILGQISIEPPKEFRIAALRAISHRDRAYDLTKYLQGGENRDGIGRCDTEGGYEKGFYRPIARFSGLIDGKTYTWGTQLGHLGCFDVGNDLNEILTKGVSVGGWQVNKGASGEFILVTELNEKNTMGKAVRYVLDSGAVMCLNEWMSECGCYERSSIVKRNAPDTIAYNIVFKDRNNGEIAAFPWVVHKSVLMNIGQAFVYDYDVGSGTRTGKCWFYTAPLVGCAGGGFIQWRDFVMEKGDLANIASVSIELAE